MKLAAIMVFSETKTSLENLTIEQILLWKCSGHKLLDSKLETFIYFYFYSIS